MFDVGGLTKGAYYLAVSAGTCGISQADLHFDAGASFPAHRKRRPRGSAFGGTGSSDARAGGLVITQLRNLTPPFIEGTPRAGDQLSANPGTWSPAGVSFAYRWYADGSLIPGENGQAYTPGIDQLGKRIRVRVIASKAGHADAGRTSAFTARVAGGP